MRIFFRLLLTFGFAIMLGACGSKDNGPTSSSTSLPAQIVATWTVQSITLNGVETQLAEALGWGPTTATLKITIEGNGKYSSSELDGKGAAVYTETGTASVDGQNITITVEAVNGQPLNPAEKKSGQWAASGNNLTLTFNDSGTIGVMRFIK